jgi:hypothetical protein
MKLMKVIITASNILQSYLTPTFLLAIGLFISAWDAISMEIRAVLESHPALVSAFLKVFQDRFKSTVIPREVTAVLMADVLNAAVKGCVASLRAEQTDNVGIPKTVELLVNMLGQFREGLFDEAHFSAVRIKTNPPDLR